MIFHMVRGNLKTGDPKEVAKVIFDFFVYQYEQAIREEISARCDYNACVAANTAAKNEYERENELGWGPKLPYNEAVLSNKKNDAADAAKHREEAKKLLDFVRDRLLDKFV